LPEKKEEEKGSGLRYDNIVRRQIFNPDSTCSKLQEIVHDGSYTGACPRIPRSLPTQIILQFWSSSPHLPAAQWDELPVDWEAVLERCGNHGITHT